MLKKKRIFSIIVSAVMMTSVLAGCGTSSSGSSDAKVTLTWETNRTDMAGTTLKDLADKYHKAHPNIIIKIESEKDSDGVMKTKAAGGELPDLSCVIGTMKKPDYPKYYADISDIGYTKDNLNVYDKGEYDGKLYGLNTTVSYTGVFYNKQSFKKAGISTPPKTMDEFYADCEKLKAAGMVPFASNYKDGWPLDPFSNNHDLACAQTGDENYNNSFATKNPFDDPNGLLYGFKFMRTMKEKGYLEKDLMSTSWDNSKKAMAQGTTAMTYLGTWFPPQVVQNGAKAEDIGMFPFPGSKALVMSGDWCLGIAKNSKHITETKAFLKWLFDGAKYQKALDIASPIKGAKQSVPGLDELLSFNLPIITEKATEDKVDKTWKESEINLEQDLQKYMITNDPNSVIKQDNDKFAAARKTVGND